MSKYVFTDNPTLSGISRCNTDVLNDCIMHLKYNSDARISNCLTEIPQRIKLELVNEVLTLKAGSQIIVPNGFEEDNKTPKFEHLTIETDITIAKPTTISTFLITCVIQGSGIFCRNNGKNVCFSGTTPPTFTGNYACWYDTKTNLLKHTSDAGVTWIAGGSLPICVEKVSSSKVVSVEQVFNGMGYIGSTIWVDKGVKGLIPDGRNEDGSLKNIEFETEKVLTETVPNTENDNFKYYLARETVYTPQIWRQPTQYDYVSETEPTQHIYSYWYNPQTNIAKRSTGDASVWIDSWTSLPVFTCTVVNGVISNFQPKTTLHALDYNDKSEISAWSMPSKTATSLSLGASGATYTAPANGWFYILKGISADGQYCQMVNHTRSYQSIFVGFTTGCAGIFPVCKGDQIQILYNLGGVTIDFKFIYAEGEVK